MEKKGKRWRCICYFCKMGWNKFWRSFWNCSTLLGIFFFDLVFELITHDFRNSQFQSSNYLYFLNQSEWKNNNSLLLSLVTNFMKLRNLGLWEGPNFFKNLLLSFLIKLKIFWPSQNISTLFYDGMR